MKTQQIEIQLLLEAMHLKYGFDFSGYSKDMLTRRIGKRLSGSKLKNIAEMIPVRFLWGGWRELYSGKIV